MRRISCLFAVCLALPIPLIAQTFPAAEIPGTSVWVGGSVSMFNPDYGCQNSSPFTCGRTQLIGISPYADTGAFLFQRIGAEGEARFLHWRGPGSLTESSYLSGPRMNLYRYRHFLLSGKFLLGKAHLNVTNGAGSGTYFAYAPGAILDYRISRRVSARLDYEYQRWPAFKGILPGGGHQGLTPNGVSLGVSYRVH